MSVWNFDIASAPRDRQILMRTTRDGDKVFVTNWLEPTKHCPSGRFNGFPENAKSLLAWCDIPAFENTQTDAAISRPDATPYRPETENRSDEEPCQARGFGEMQDEDAIHLPTRSDGGLNIVHKHKQINEPEPDRSFLITPEEEKEPASVEAVTTAASGGAGASKVICPALIDDVGGQ